MLASHPLDLQTFPSTPSGAAASAADKYSFTYQAPVGPPTVNVEAKLLGVNDEAIESGADPIGSLFVRAPPVGRLLNAEDLGEEEERGWIETGERARVLTNGTFKVALTSRK